MMHYVAPSLLGNRLRHSMEELQLKCGVGKNFLNISYRKYGQ